jgi:hypothetical protein
MAVDGFVTGLEPATNFPNPRTFEQEQGRVIVLKPGASAHFDVTLDIHATAQDVSSAEQAIVRIQAGRQPKVHSTPQEGWSKIG